MRPVRRRPDANPNITYAGVGRVISAWEQLEARLAEIYSIFVRKPREVDAVIKYGRDTSQFKNRMAALSRAAERYFCNQTHEAEFDDLISKVKELHILRTQITHGIVATIPITGENDFYELGYSVVPPWYAFHQLTKHNELFYIYNSTQLDVISNKVALCTNNLIEYRISLEPSWKEPPAPFGQFIWYGQLPGPLSPLIKSRSTS